MIRIEREGGIVRLLLDRPQRRNAFDDAMARALLAAIEDAQRAPETRLIVIKSAGEVFSTGRDLKAAAEPDAGGHAPGQRMMEVWTRIFQALYRSNVPSVAVVRGYAVAGGFTLAMGCDFVLADRTAVFGAYEMKNGFAAAICTPLLARLAGPRIGLELAMFGEPIPAERLHALGLINRLAEDAAELARIEAEFVGRIASLDPGAVKATRDLFRAAETMPLENALDMGCNLNLLIEASGTFAAAGRKLGKGR